jgi:hypothetical protein
MNRLMKDIVDIAFRLSAWDREKKAALGAKKRPPPLPKVVADFLRGMAGRGEPSPTGGLHDDVTEAEHHAILRAGVTLDWFARAGCPIVSLDEPTARGFASSEPPAERDALEWPLGVVYGLSVGQGAILVRHQMVPTRMPEAMKPHFTMNDGVVPMEAWTAGMAPYPGEDALANLTSNVGAALVKRPDGLEIAERHPSRQAARKQGLNPNHVPSVEFVIGAEMTLGSPRPGVESGEGSEGGRSMNVRTIVSPHWTHQVCGTGRSERRLQWIATHWRGPEDAPVSVHATRVLGAEKPVKGSGKT